MGIWRKLGLLATLVLCAPAALAHEVGEPATTTWSFEPAVVIPLVIAAVLFAVGAWRRRGRPGWSWAQVGLFSAGWATLFIALVTPIHALGSELFWVHMSQHELLMVVAAPLLVLSRPVVWFLWALPQDWRESAGGFAKRGSVDVVWSVMTLPLFVWLLHGATLWSWHIPYLYDASVEYEWVHALQHTMFLGTALLFWWTLIHGRHGRLSSGVGIIYCFTTAIHTSVLGALMTFAQQGWYPIYEGRTAAFHITPLQDQQIGGLIMWVPAGVIFTALGVWLTAVWINESARRVQYTSVEKVMASPHSPNPGGCGAPAISNPLVTGGRSA